MIRVGYWSSVKNRFDVLKLMIFQIGLLIMNQCGTGFAHIKLVKKGKSRMTAKRYTILVSSTRKIVLAIAQWSLINARKIPFIGLYLLEFYHFWTFKIDLTMENIGGWNGSTVKISC